MNPKKEYPIKFAGKLAIPGGRIDVGDPCYDRDDLFPGGIVTDLEIVSGNYDCYYDLMEHPTFGKRIAAMMIAHENYPDEPLDCDEFVATVGVDAGLMSITAGTKPNYNDQQWKNFCAALGEDYPTVKIRKKMFICSSGLGDGVYDLSVHRNSSGKIDAVQVTFLFGEED